MSILAVPLMALALAWLIESLVKTSHPKGAALRFISSALVYALIAAVTLTGEYQVAYYYDAR